MKKKIAYFYLVTIILCFASCEEVGPVIILEESQIALVDTNYISSTPITAGVKNILFEEFSGVRCFNCPAGNVATHDMVITHGERIVPVTIHSDLLALPYTLEDPDLRNTDAELIANTLGPVGVKPSCFINRKTINGDRLQTSIGTWESSVLDELSTSTNVNMQLEILATNIVERTMTYRITLEYASDVTGHNLGFFLTESHIIAEQLDGSIHVLDYEHEYILRKSITPIIGEPLTVDLLENTVIIKEFEIDINDYDSANEWQIENMHLVAFIREANDNIANATMVDIIE
ncbi:MAG: Omp28-related outer membrane protein [Chitinophagales bacterium]